jgi:hypothetical protein
MTARCPHCGKPIVLSAPEEDPVGPPSAKLRTGFDTSGDGDGVNDMELETSLLVSGTRRPRGCSTSNRAPPKPGVCVTAFRALIRRLSSSRRRKIIL